MSDLNDAVQRCLEIWNITDPATRLERIKEIWAAEGSYNVARFTWHLVPAPGAEPIAIGFDVAVLDDEGKIKAFRGSRYCPAIARSRCGPHAISEVDRRIHTG